MTTTAVQFVPFDADRATLLAHLDAHPWWARNRRDSGNGYLVWELTAEACTELYGHLFHQHGRAVLLTESAAAHHPPSDTGTCEEAAYVINAVALGLDLRTSTDVVDWLVAIYRLAEPGGAIALIASGQVVPE
ncbi:hypothetical protein PS9374_04600 [Planomonospora sphaerica]|uniref:Uncharacterized protein n=1 Tax=Planomonospora sphaerica TaxID=161355 RepID=A0A161LN33_9ACTN|nr:hypothetical protein [Planomonospora sphaerica]GAT68935.1 hypothetical protein PS9374_04600 [Planomonospora sphaerica]